MGLTRYELRDQAEFQDEHVFTVNKPPVSGVETGLYFYKTDRVPHARQYKYASDLGEYVRSNAKHVDTPPATLTFSIADSERVSNSAKALAGVSGTITVQQVTFPMKTGATDMSESYIIAAGETSDGKLLDTEVCRDIFELKVTNVDEQSVSVSPNLDVYLTQQVTERHEEVKGRNTETYLDKKDLLERQYKDKIVEYEMKVDKLESKIREKQKLERQAGSAAERLKVASEVQVLRKKARALNREKYDLEDSMDDEISEKIMLAQQAAEGHVSTTGLFDIKFHIA